MKSICPPMPEKMRWPIESAQTWPVRSTSSAELIAVDPVVLADQGGVVGAIAAGGTRPAGCRRRSRRGAASRPRSDVTIRPGCTVLAAFVITPRSMQLDQPVREHLGVDAEVVLVAEAAQHGVRDRADADLEGGAVLDQPGDQLADACLDRRSRREPRCSCSGRLVRMNACTRRQRHRRVAVGARHLVVDLGDDRGARDRRRLGPRPPTCPACRGRARSGGESCSSATSSGIRPLENSAGDLRQEDREEVGAPLGDRPGGAAAPTKNDTERIRPRHSGSANGAGPDGVQVVQRHALEVAPVGEGVEQGRRRRGRAVHEHTGAAGDGPCCVLW